MDVCGWVGSHSGSVKHPHLSNSLSFLPPAELMKASQQAIERGVKDCLFIDFKRRSGHFDVTTVASIKEITEKVSCRRLSQT